MTQEALNLAEIIEHFDSNDESLPLELLKEISATLRALAQTQEPVANRAFLERTLIAMEGVIDVADRKTDEFDALRACIIELTLMLYTTPPQRTEQNFCSRCGKRTADLTVIHTCTPPQENP